MAEAFIRAQKTEVQRLLGLPPNAFRLFWVIAVEAGFERREAFDAGVTVHVGDGEWLASEREAAMRAGIGINTFRRSLADLQRAGVISAVRASESHNARTLYRIANPGLWGLSKMDRLFGPWNPPNGPSKTDPQGGSKTDAVSITGRSKTDRPISKNRSRVDPKRTSDILAPVVQSQNAEPETDPSPTPSAEPEPEGKKEEVERLGTGLQEHRAAGAAEQQAFRVAGEGWVSGIVPVDGPPRSETDFLQGLIDQAYGKNGRTGR